MSKDKIFKSYISKLLQESLGIIQKPIDTRHMMDCNEGKFKKSYSPDQDEIALLNSLVDQYDSRPSDLKGFDAYVSADKDTYIKTQDALNLKRNMKQIYDIITYLNTDKEELLKSLFVQISQDNHLIKYLVDSMESLDKERQKDGSNKKENTNSNIRF